MKASQLKKIIKPIVKECVHEALLKEGLLSNIVSEVAQGLGNQAILENKETIVPEQSNENSVRMQQLREQRLREQQATALESIGKGSFNGVNIFEGTTPLAATADPTPQSQAGALSDQDPSDPGVDISSFISNGGHAWKQLVEGKV
jgi:nitrogen regulatory protein PII